MNDKVDKTEKNLVYEELRIFQGPFLLRCDVA